MQPTHRRGRQVLSIVIALAAVGWGAAVVRQALQSDDGGPPIGALCAGSPAVLLIVAAGAVWPAKGRNHNGSE